MKDLSIMQKYMVCALDQKGNFSPASTERAVCLVAAGLLELRLEGCIDLEGRRARAAGPLPQGRRYLEPLYEEIARKPEVKLDSLVETYCMSVTDRRFHELKDGVGASLTELGLAEERRAGLLGNQRGYVCPPEAVRPVVEQMRAELLEEGEVTEDTAALAVLLEKGKCLKPYFSDFEWRDMKKRLEELAASPEGKLVQEMLSWVDDIMAVLWTAALT